MDTYYWLTDFMLPSNSRAFPSKLIYYRVILKVKFLSVSQWTLTPILEEIIFFVRFAQPVFVTLVAALGLNLSSRFW